MDEYNGTSGFPEQDNLVIEKYTNSRIIPNKIKFHTIYHLKVDKQ